MPAILSDLERKILDYMVQYLRTHTYQPSIREIGEEFGIKSTKTVSEHLGALAEKGYLERNPSRSRGVRILDVDLHPETVSVPCYDQLVRPGARGERAAADTYLSLDRRLGGAKGAYFVRARGSQYAGVGIRDGDLFLVEPRGAAPTADGELVVVATDEGPALYRAMGAGSTWTLEPAAGGTPVVVDDPASLDVIGRVTVLHRRLDGAGVPRSPVAH
jgi:repressor LexA